MCGNVSIRSTNRECGRAGGGGWRNKKPKKAKLNKSKEVGDALFNDVLNTFYLRLCEAIQMVNGH